MKKTEMYNEIQKTNLMAEVTINEDDFFVSKHGMPGLRIHVTKEGEEDEDTYYLYPFRGYSFQVCGTEDGQWDYGSSRVIGLGNVYQASTRSIRAGWGWQSNLAWGNADSSVCIALYEGLINTALMQFFNGKEFRGHCKAGEDENGKPKFTNINYHIHFNFNRDITWQFALICMVWATYEMGHNVVSEEYNSWATKDYTKKILRQMFPSLKAEDNDEQ